MTPRIGLGYVPSLSVKISRRRKEKQSLVQYVIAEEVANDEGENATSNSKSLVFDRLRPSMS